MKTILVPSDFSEQAGYALDFAFELAKKNQSKLILLHVVEGVGVASGAISADMASGAEVTSDDVYMLQLIRVAKDKLADTASESRFSEVELETKIQIGNPYGSIAEEVTENDVDLVIMGSTGASGIDEVLIGSNTEKVVRYSKCPVLTVKSEVKCEDIKNIAFATNFTDTDENVIKELVALQKTLGAKLHLIRVNTPSNFTVDREAKKLMSEYAEKHGLEDFTLNIYNDLDEEDGILFFARETGADLIAMATHGRTGFFHLISGSIAEDVVNHAQKPVWTCRIL
ncbi:universal stress protein UspA [Fulvitalea axinellae]|uniref:Universal stress protein UspA n=1 Tax=Fulvitalea axinellae TaxID=1182444 RepID=A0AAU9D831_9BACT|nr:universal stress protein UspA [Fulvitalea axinellae]